MDITENREFLVITDCITVEHDSTRYEDTPSISDISNESERQRCAELSITYCRTVISFTHVIGH